MLGLPSLDSIDAVKILGVPIMPCELKNVLKVVDPTGLTYYLGTITPEEIKALTFVPVVTETSQQDNEVERLKEVPGGYQRSGDTKRMIKIKEFIVKRPSCLIPPVLLSARGKWKFTPSSSTNKNIGTIQADEQAAIIDGQHRLGGLLQLAVDDNISDDLKKRPIPFMAIDSMDLDIEKQEFVDINGNQKGVKKSLLVYLEREDNFSAMAALALMEDEESVFKGRIDTQKKHDWTVFLFGAAKECIDLTYSRSFIIPKGFDPFSSKDVRPAAIEFVLNYWRAVRDAMPEFWADMDKMPNFGVKKSKDKPGTTGFDYRLLEETGIRAFSKLASELFVTTWIDGMKSPSFELITNYLDQLAAREQVKLVLSKPSKNEEVLKIDSDLRSTGKAGVDAIFIHLKSELQRVIQGG